MNQHLAFVKGAWKLLIVSCISTYGAYANTSFNAWRLLCCQATIDYVDSVNASTER